MSLMAQSVLVISVSESVIRKNDSSDSESSYSKELQVLSLEELDSPDDVTLRLVLSLMLLLNCHISSTLLVPTI